MPKKLPFRWRSVLVRVYVEIFSRLYVRLCYGLRFPMRASRFR